MPILGLLRAGSVERTIVVDPEINPDAMQALACMILRSWVRLLYILCALRAGYIWIVRNLFPWWYSRWHPSLKYIWSDVMLQESHGFVLTMSQKLSETTVREALHTAGCGKWLERWCPSQENEQ